MKTIFTWLGFGFFVILSLVMSGLYILELNATRPSMETDQPAEQTIELQPEIAADITEESLKTQTVYDANVGKFSLSIPNEYVVIVRSDGTYDGVRSTSIEVARASKKGVVYNAFDDYLKIEAFPANVNGTRDQFISTDTMIQAASSKESRSLVDGIEARVFMIDTYGQTKKYYFERDGITYVIESWNVKNGDTQSMLDAVVNGFSFN